MKNCKIISFNPLLTIIIAGIFSGFIILLTGILLGEIFYKETWKALFSDQITEEAVESYKLTQKPFWDSILELHSVTVYNPNIKTVKIFIIEDDKEAVLYVADNVLDINNKKEIYRIDKTKGFSFIPYSIRSIAYGSIERVFIGYGGNDTRDILVFTPYGEVITDSLIDKNKELEGWMVFYDTRESEYLLRLRLYKRQREWATALIDIRTGEMIADSFKITE